MCSANSPSVAALRAVVRSNTRRRIACTSTKFANGGTGRTADDEVASMARALHMLKPLSRAGIEP